MLHVAWSPSYVLPVPPVHRFPMSKYDLLKDQLLHEGTITRENLFEPEKVAEKDILNTHYKEYWSKLKTLNLSPSEVRKTGFSLSKMLVDREVKIMGGTLEAAKHALINGVAMNIAGGTHHAYSDRGEGFCLLNDIAISANYLLERGTASRILVVDLDVHQGNGTAEIFQNEERVYTFSMHGANNYPMTKEKSDWDIPLPDGTEDKTYLNLLQKALDQIGAEFDPNFIFFQSGVDILESDKLGKLSLTINGCKERDRIVLDFAHSNGIPMTASMGGGYSEDIKIIVEAHANTYRLAQEIFF
jgi:acetoin utilization deacetylase AcuC-like enzyme